MYKYFIFFATLIFGYIAAQEDELIGEFEENVSQEAAQSGVGAQVVQENEECAGETVGERYQRLQEASEEQSQEGMEEGD